MADIDMKEWLTLQYVDRLPLLPEQQTAFETVCLDHSAPIEPLAEQIAKPIIESSVCQFNNTAPEQEVSHLAIWRMIELTIHEYESQIDRMVELTVALAKYPDPTPWDTLTSDMGMWWSENTGLQVPLLDDPNRFKIRQRYINMTAFEAKISLTGTHGLNKRWVTGPLFTRALEDTPWEVYHVKYIENMLLHSFDVEDSDYEEDERIYRIQAHERRSVRILDYWAPAAAAWIDIDAKGVYECTGLLFHEAAQEESARHLAELEKEAAENAAAQLERGQDTQAEEVTDNVGAQVEEEKDNQAVEDAKEKTETQAEDIVAATGDNSEETLEENADDADDNDDDDEEEEDDDEDIDSSDEVEVFYRPIPVVDCSSDDVSAWKGEKGYSKERFRFWGERFDWISKTVRSGSKEDC